LKVFVVTRQMELDQAPQICGVCKTVYSANFHIKHLIEEKFNTVIRWDITEFEVIEN